MDNQIKAFMKRLDELSTGDRVALKRSAGVMLNETDGKAIAAFYRALPGSVPYKEDRWFAAACLKCMWDPAQTEGSPVETVLAGLLRGEELSDSMAHRIEALLDTDWDEDGFLLTKLCRMMKLIRGKTAAQIDFAALLEDLLYWNNDNQSVQRKWAHTIFTTVLNEEGE